MANEQNLKPFQPGQSGNPKGKPKGTKSISTNIKLLLSKRQELSSDSPIGKAGQKKTWSEIIAAKIVVDAANGNVKAQREILDRTEGKITQPLSHIGLQPIICSNTKDKEALEDNYNEPE